MADLVTWNSGLLALCVHCVGCSSRSGEWNFDAQGKSRVIFFNFALATTKNWVLFFLQYRGNDLLIFQDAKAKEEAQREKKLASLCRYPSHSSWWKSDVHCLFVFYIHPLRTINKPLPNLLDKGSNDTWAQKSIFNNTYFSLDQYIIRFRARIVADILASEASQVYRK